MRSYSIYRHIRQRALIFGLSIGSFALQMAAVIGSLMVIIFSFDLLLILFLGVGNVGLYIFLLRSSTLNLNLAGRNSLRFISNKKIGFSSYEN